MTDTDRPREKVWNGVSQPEVLGDGWKPIHWASHPSSAQRQQPPCRAWNLTTLSPDVRVHRSYVLFIWYIHGNMKHTHTHTSLHACQTNAEYTHTHTQTSETPTIVSLSFHHVPNDPHSAPVINCPWTDLLFLSKHMMSNTWPHKHMTASLTSTEHCLTVLCILIKYYKRRNVREKMIACSLFSQNVIVFVGKMCPGRNSQTEQQNGRQKKHSRSNSQKKKHIVLTKTNNK